MFCVVCACVCVCVCGGGRGRGGLVSFSGQLCRTVSRHRIVYCIMFLCLVVRGVCLRYLLTCVCVCVCAWSVVALPAHVCLSRCVCVCVCVFRLGFRFVCVWCLGVCVWWRFAPASVYIQILAACLSVWLLCVECGMWSLGDLHIPTCLRLCVCVCVCA